MTPYTLRISSGTCVFDDCEVRLWDLYEICRQTLMAWARRLTGLQACQEAGTALHSVLRRSPT